MLLAACFDRSRALYRPAAPSGCGLILLARRSRGSEPPDVVYERLRFIRLRIMAGLAQLGCGIGRSRRASDKYHVEAGTVGAYPSGQGKSVRCARHFDVAEDHVDTDLGMLKNNQRFVPACCFDDLVTAAAEILGNRHPNENLVLDHEDGVRGGGDFLVRNQIRTTMIFIWF